MTVPDFFATASVLVWIAYWIGSLYGIIQEDGSWYNELKTSGRDTFTNRAVYTLRNRIILWKSIGMFVVVSAVVWGFVYVFVTGLLVIV